ncbi:TetR family transcriptional regulator C-terminal domain-containing protein [Flavobacterium sp.]|uniref:TetR family transcriptional regulator C-terminal domain-containing protein n=1 Tax=Flavobacterium sp. TaxID=239 RepID=UPI0008CF4371|nr:TetR family transcriptional regulator C-terminal domain-containing protein [Flavobacterium sp.]OGS60293.1 MAG: heat-shock protein [Flavobacteria bacterium GWF1_32_7]HBD27360.1 heat-shock protein [Flavobacterium sp.]
MAKKKEITNQDILGFYIDYFLENNKAPHSVYKFAKHYNFEETVFYANFSSFEQIEKTFFTSLFQQTMSLLEKSEDFESYDARTKLLSFYFTYFEMLTANRSFTVALLKEDKNKLKSLSKLTELRKHFKQFFDTLEIEKIDLKQEKLIEFQEKTMSEMAWLQFLFTLKFWIEDTSLSFEKTDIFIEKSVNTSFDLMDIAPLKSLIDFGKFMWQEKASFKM